MKFNEAKKTQMQDGGRTVEHQRGESYEEKEVQVCNAVLLNLQLNMNLHICAVSQEKNNFQGMKTYW